LVDNYTTGSTTTRIC